MATPVKRPKIVVVGGGFAGLFSAKQLLKRLGEHADIEIISDINYFVFQPLLPEVAAGTINSQDAVSPLRSLLPHAMVRLATVVGVDTDRREVKLIQGQKRKLQSLAYDELVLTTGQETRLSMFTGFDHHSLTMKNLSDAYHLRNHVIQCLEMADVTRFPEIKKRALTFVVAGGGFSGVETMGELVEMIHRVRHQYPHIGAEEVRTVLIQRGDRLLPEMSPQLSEYARKDLEKRGVEVWLNTSIHSASRYSVCMADGRKIPTNTIVTTIGNGPSGFIQSLPVQLCRGKIQVDRCLRAVGVKHVWALGDAALVPLHNDGEKECYAPPTAQFASKEGQVLAENIRAVMEGREPRPFVYTAKGTLASLGGYSGVAEIYGFKFTGIFAWLLWRFIYIGMLPGFPAKLRVSLNWLFDYFMPRTIVYMNENNRPATQLLNYATGEIVHEVNEVLEGFYVVISGRFERTIPGKDGEPDRVRIFNCGDSWGERCLADHRLTIGQVKALEDGEVLLFRADDFERFRGAFSPFDKLLTRREKTTGAIEI